MFTWLRRRRRRVESEPVSDPHERDRDSGEEEQGAHEADVSEASPFGLTRLKTDDL
jgi:hypothetical protein